MADLQCLICDYTVEPESTDDELLRLLGVQSASSTETLIRHMEGHDLADWIKAFKMADAYIEQLERKITDLESRPAAPVSIVREAPSLTNIGAAYDEVLSPHEVAEKRRQAAVRARVQSHNPDETLIPRIPEGQRAEGVVGVKY